MRLSGERNSGLQQRPCHSREAATRGTEAPTAPNHVTSGHFATSKRSTFVIGVFTQQHPDPHLKCIKRLSANALVSIGNEHARIKVVLSELEILSFDVAAAEKYGPLRAQLERKGLKLDEADLRIACIALVNDCTLITGNTRHVARLDELRVENWLKS
jgi:hypothetical protein